MASAMNERDAAGKLPTCFFKVFNEVKPQHGEDNYCMSFCAEGVGLVGVFDGCGGSGAFRHSAYTDHTEAYMASRMCAGVFNDCFQDAFPRSQTDDEFARTYCARVQTLCARVMDRYAPPAKDGPTMKGSMVRTLPTTAAAALISNPAPNRYSIYPIWAGDSRIYAITSAGLAQLTADDCSVTDPFDNLYENGALRNFISQGRPVKLKMSRVDVAEPVVVFAATDGCFGYYSTPMEFEGIILGALMTSSTPEQWEQAVQKQLCDVAGDDVTLILAAYGYSSFEELKTSLTARYQTLYQQYLAPLGGLDPTDRQSRHSLWLQYKPDYLRFLEGKG